MNTTQKKKVLFLITKSNWGGAQRYVYDLATHLDRDRFEPVVTLGGSGQLAELLTHAGIRVIRISALDRDISIKKELAVMRELWQILRTERPAILHVNSSKAGGVGALLGRLAGVPRVIFTAHGWAFNEDRPRWQKLIIKFLHWSTVLLAHRTIAVSRALVREMNWPGARTRMRVLNPGRTIGAMFNKSEARAYLSSLSPALSASAREQWIGCIAELHPIKRHRILIQAFKGVHTALPRTRLVIIGSGEEASRLTSYINQQGLRDSVILLGAVPEAARYLHAFDCFALASKSESYGYVIHEAGLAGVPVVATSVGGISDIVTHPESGLLVPPEAPEPLRDALLSTLRDREAAAARSARLLEAMRARNVEQMTRATEALYTL